MSRTYTSPVSGCKFSSAGRFLLAAASVLLATPAVVGLFYDAEMRSSFERRTLSEFPASAETESLRAYFTQLDAYLNDHFGFAVEMNQLFRKIRYYVFQDDPTPNTTKGKDGFVFLNSHHRGQRYGAFMHSCQGNKDRAEERAASWSKTIKWHENRGYNVVLAVAPSKPVLYPDKLPHTVPQTIRAACAKYRHVENQMRQLQESAAAEGWKLYYPFEQMYSLRNDETYYPKENFHWRGKSTHLFAKGLFQVLGIEVPPDHSAKPYLRQVPADMVGSLGFKRTITITDYNYDSYGIREFHNRPKLVNKYYERARDFHKITSKNPLSQRTALLLSNSFGRNLAKHLAPGYARVIHVNTNHLQQEERKRFFTEFVDQIAPDDIIFVVHDAETRAGPGNRFRPPDL